LDRLLEDLIARRTLFRAAGGAVLAAPAAALAQPGRVHRLGILRTARALGLSLSPTLLAQAARVIE
jgi:hypothetical protein